MNEFNLLIHDLNVDGGAVARLDGRVYFLDRGLPGEIVRAEVTGQKKRILFGRVLQTLRPSPDAVPAFCPYFGLCGGCTLQNLSYPAQLEFKQRRVAAVLAKIGKLGDLAGALPGLSASGDALSASDAGLEGVFAGALPEILPSPRLRGYRNKMEYAFGIEQPDEGAKTGAQLVLGLHRRASQQVLNIEFCPLQSPRSGLILQAVRDWARAGNFSVWRAEATAKETLINEQSGNAEFFRLARRDVFSRRGLASSGLPPEGKSKQQSQTEINQRFPGGCLRHLVLREPEYLLENNIPQCSVELVCGEVLPPPQAVDELWQKLAALGVTVFLLGQRRSSYNLAKSERIVKSYGQATLWEKFGPLLLELPVRGFAQTNTGAAALLYQRVAALAAGEDFNYKVLWDVYCGSGALALYLAPGCASVLGIEQDGEAVDMARVNAARLGLGQCSFLAGDAAGLLAARSAGFSISGQAGKVSRAEQAGQTDFTDAARPDLLLADPPRGGMSPKALAAIKKCTPRRIIYVSCDPATLARDLAGLSDNYTLSGLTLLDMFPHSTHVETIARLDLRNK